MLLICLASVCQGGLVLLAMWTGSLRTGCDQERHLDCLVEGAKGNRGCRDLATAGWLQVHWHGRQKRRGAQSRKPLHNGYWESWAPENGHGEPGSLNPSYRMRSRQAPGVGMGRSQRSGVGLARCPYTVPSYPKSLLVPEE